MKNTKQPRTKAPKQRPRAKREGRVKAYLTWGYTVNGNIALCKVETHTPPFDSVIAVPMTILLGRPGIDFTISPLPRSRK